MVTSSLHVVGKHCLTCVQRNSDMPPPPPPPAVRPQNYCSFESQIHGYIVTYCFCCFLITIIVVSPYVSTRATRTYLLHPLKFILSNLPSAHCLREANLLIMVGTVILNCNVSAQI